MPALLEHANFTVSDPAATAAWMQRAFDWEVRWEGDAMAGGHTKHVGTADHYVALYHPGVQAAAKSGGYQTLGHLNHLAVVVDDLASVETALRAEGFSPKNHADYEPGRRFYFHDADGIEYEVVQYD